MLDFFLDILDPGTIIREGGVALLFIVVFLETGLFFGFFLPGDSLLFMAGLFCHSRYITWSPGALIIALVVAAVSGTLVGYATGRWTKGWIMRQKEGIFFRKKYLHAAEVFYKKYGMLAFVLGRFLPIVRTFVPILAGLVRIDLPRFMFFNFLGACVWVTGMVMAGYWLGGRFPGLDEHVEFIVAILIVLTTVPVVVTYMKNRNQAPDQDVGEAKY